jgi:hypothetical protein
MTQAAPPTSIDGAADLMSFQKAAQFLRMVHLSQRPYETAREISANQFRPTTEETDGTFKREPTADANN